MDASTISNGEFGDNGYPRLGTGNLYLPGNTNVFGLCIRMQPAFSTGRIPHSKLEAWK
jgi:hypothetical protein